MRINFWLCMVLAVVLMAVGCETGGHGDDECLTSTPCVDSSDCDSGQHCNTALATPMCQVLYCGQDGSECSEDELCTGRNCDDGICVCEPACGANECGLDPVCGTQNCGNCGDGETCQSGQCKTGTVAGEMKLVAAGSFWMGCNTTVDSECQSDESPYHQVTLSGYYMDKTEVTQAEYKKCVDAGECDTPSCDWDPTGTPNRPVVCVTWSQAGEYCVWAGKRLPTEAEWEKAARGTDGRKYPWGNETATCDYAVMYGCPGDAMDVCSKSPSGDSPYGLCDMAGNVWEWVSDWYDSGYYANSPASNPTGPVSGSIRVLRGGSFYFNVDDALRASNRHYYYPSDYNYNLGFRCVRPQ